MVLFVVAELCRLSYHVLTQANFVSEDSVVTAIQNLTIVEQYSISSFLPQSYSPPPVLPWSARTVRANHELDGNGMTGVALGIAAWLWALWDHQIFEPVCRSLS